MIKKWLRFLDLKSNVDDFDEIHQSIKNGIIFKGTNLWILVFAIVIASIGLNTNSTAVIIGAMLISPLMGPINGMGYSIATYDFILFRRALKNFAFAVAASLIASTAYFSVTPISTAHSELLARTSPTIYDVLIALFGGLAGIVAISSRHKGNVIQGVAIATALMPPLCTAGYGLATAQFTYFFGAFYLFTINTVFIGISSVLFAQLLNLPIRTIVEPEQKRKINRWISVVITITIIPSIYFGYLLVEKEKFTEKANQLVNLVSVVKGSYLLKYNINPRNQVITLTYGGNLLSEQDKESVKSQARELDLVSELDFVQGFSIEDVTDDISEVDHSLRSEINRLNLALLQSQKHNDSIQQASVITKQLFKEARSLYPEIASLVHSNSFEFTVSNDSLKRIDSVKVTVVIVGTKRNALTKAERIQIENWLKTKLSKYPVRVSYQ